MDEIYSAISKKGMLVTSYIVLVEHMDTDGERHLKRFTSDMPPWQWEGMLHYAIGVFWDEEGNPVG